MHKYITYRYLCLNFNEKYKKCKFKILGVDVIMSSEVNRCINENDLLNYKSIPKHNERWQENKVEFF